MDRPTDWSAVRSHHGVRCAPSPLKAEKRTAMPPTRRVVGIDLAKHLVHSMVPVAIAVAGHALGGSHATCAQECSLTTIISNSCAAHGHTSGRWVHPTLSRRAHFGRVLSAHVTGAAGSSPVHSVRDGGPRAVAIADLCAARGDLSLQEITYGAAETRQSQARPSCQDAGPPPHERRGCGRVHGGPRRHR